MLPPTQIQDWLHRALLRRLRIPWLVRTSIHCPGCLCVSCSVVSPSAPTPAEPVGPSPDALHDGVLRGRDMYAAIGLYFDGRASPLLSVLRTEDARVAGAAIPLLAAKRYGELTASLQTGTSEFVRALRVMCERQCGPLSEAEREAKALYELDKQSAAGCYLYGCALRKRAGRQSSLCAGGRPSATCYRSGSVVQSGVGCTDGAVL
jgi:hypothetical protein